MAYGAIPARYTWRSARPRPRLASCRLPSRPAAFRRSAGFICRRSVSNAPCAISTATCPPMRPTSVPGSITASGAFARRSGHAARRRRAIPSITNSCRCTATGSIRFPVGPVHAGIIEPGHFRFTANGETVARLEERLGYVHKGVDGLLTDVDLDKAARIVARVSGDSTVALGFAFARAVEAALDVTVPPRAVVLRGVMAELERIANHFGDVGAICNDAAFALIHAHCGIFRERVLAASDRAFGHRLMMDRIVPGGVAGDISSDGAAAIIAALDDVDPRFAEIVDLYDETPSLQDRTCHDRYRRRRSRAAVGGGRLRRPRIEARFRCAARSCLSALPRPPLRCAGARRGRCRRPAARARRRDRRKRAHDQDVACRSAGRAGDRAAAAGDGAARGRRRHRSVPRRCAGVAAACARRARRALPCARRLVVPVAAARSRDREQHRRRLSRSATNRSTAPIRVTISRPCARSY